MANEESYATFGGLLLVRLTRYLFTAFVLIISCYSLGFGLGLFAPSPQVLLPLVLFVIVFAGYLVFPYVDEKWTERKQKAKTASLSAPEASPIVADPGVTMQKPVSPAPTEVRENGGGNDTSRASVPGSEIPSASALPPLLPSVTPASGEPQPISDPPPNPRVAKAEAERKPVPTEIDWPAVRERLHHLLSTLDNTSSLTDLVPDILRFFQLVPEERRSPLSKRPRTLADHLILARRFERSGLTQQQFLEESDKEARPNNKADSEGLSLSLSTLQDAERELRWLHEYYRRLPPLPRVAEGKGKATKETPKRKKGKGKAN